MVLYLEIQCRSQWATVRHSRAVFLSGGSRGGFCAFSTFQRLLTSRDLWSSSCLKSQQWGRVLTLHHSSLLFFLHLLRFRTLMLGPILIIQDTLPTLRLIGQLVSNLNSITTLILLYHVR